MSDLPNSDNSSQAQTVISPPPTEVMPPPQYAGYTRGGPTVIAGSPDNLENLAAGYFGLSGVFLFHVVYIFAGMAVTIALSSNGGQELGSIIWLLVLLSSLIIIPVIGYKPIKKIGSVLAWPEFLNVVFAISLVFIGIIGYIVVQSIAGSEIKKYGLKRRFFGGYKKQDIAAAVAAMRSSPYYQAQQPQQIV